MERCLKGRQGIQEDLGPIQPSRGEPMKTLVHPACSIHSSGLIWLIHCWGDLGAYTQDWKLKKRDIPNPLNLRKRDLNNKIHPSQSSESWVDEHLTQLPAENTHGISINFGSFMPWVTIQTGRAFWWNCWPPRGTGIPCRSFSRWNKGRNVKSEGWRFISENMEKTTLNSMPTHDTDFGIQMPRTIY